MGQAKSGGGRTIGIKESDLAENKDNKLAFGNILLTLVFSTDSLISSIYPDPSGWFVRLQEVNFCTGS